VMGDRVIQHSVVDGGVAEAARSLQDTHGLLVGNVVVKRAETFEAREQGEGLSIGARRRVNQSATAFSLSPERIFVPGADAFSFLPLKMSSIT
jgi:hypothetical protein